MHKMALDLDQTKIALDNATNQLMALQHNQFVENRVYEDDETLSNVENVPTRSDQDQSETKPSMASAIQKALETGAQMRDKYFDKVSVDLSDSEDDDNDAKNVVLHPRDPYKNRPLPYLIGSKEWYEKWHIGLVESDSEYASASDNENDDDSASSTPSHSMSTNVPGSLSDSEPSPQLPSSSHKVVREISPYSSSENLSQVQHESSFDTSDRTNAPKAAERIPQPIDPRDFNANNSIFVKQRPVNPMHVTPNLIDDEPPALDNDTPAARKKPVNLFLDDDDDNNSNDFNIFDDVNANSAASKRPRNTSHSNQAQQSKTMDGRRKNPVNLFADDDTDDFDTMMPSTSKAVPTIMQRKVDSKVANLFEDDDDDDNDVDSDLFIKPVVPASSRSSILSNAPPKKDVFMCNLFDDEPPDDDFEVFTTSSKPGAEAKIENVKEKQKPLEAYEDSVSEKAGKAKPRGNVILFDDQPPDDDFDVFEPNLKQAAGAKIEKSKSKVQEGLSEAKVHVTDKNAGAKTIKSINLFDDEPLEDDFDVFKTTPKTDKPKIIENSSESNIVEKKNHAKVTKSIALFDDEQPEDDFDMFKPTAKLATEAKVDKPQPINKHDVVDAITTKKPDTTVISKTSLFDDDDDADDMFKTISKPLSQTKSITKEIKEVPKSSSQVKSIWDSDDEVTMPVKSPKSNTSATKSKTSYDSIRLFDDTPPDDDGDLFARKPTKPKTVTITSRAQGEFYNDFLETIVVKPDAAPTQAEAKPISNEVTNVAPVVEVAPTQVLSEQSLPKEVSVNAESQKEHSAKESKPSEISKKIDLLTKSVKGDESKIETESAARPQPKKLNMGKIDINVAALLPGAKRTKSAEAAISSGSEVESIPTHKSIDVGDVKPSTTKAVSQDNVDDTGRLTNLNRDRAKVAVNRRPSTRHGRKQQYQKTLDESESVDSVDNRSATNIPDNEVFEKEDDEDDLVFERSEKLEEAKALEDTLDEKLVEPERSVQKIAEVTPPDVVQEKVEAEPVAEIDIPPLDDPEVTARDPSPTANVNESSLSDETDVAQQDQARSSKSFLDASIFDDDDDMGFDDFDISASRSSSIKPVETKTSLPVKVTPAFIDDLPPDLDSVDESIFAAKNDQSSTALSRNALDLFGDDDDDDFDNDNDNIFGSRKSSGSKTPTIDDSNDLMTPSDDWSAYPSVMPSTVNASNRASALTNTVFLNKSPPSLESKKNLSLFGESDSDDDNIFSSASSTKKSTKSQVTKAESSSAPSTSNTPASAKPAFIDSGKKVFSDESTDDDLFGGDGGAKKKMPANQSKAEASNPTPKAEALKPTPKAEASRPTPKSGKSIRLFSDSDDDDDDLFGGKSKKVLVSTKKASATDTARPAKATASGETASSNPLSDLLK